MGKRRVRKDDHGSTLLKEVEKIAKEKGCKLVHLDTFDFQAKDFYLKRGYEIFDVLLKEYIVHFTLKGESNWLPLKIYFSIFRLLMKNPLNPFIILSSSGV